MFGPRLSNQITFQCNHYNQSWVHLHLHFKSFLGEHVHRPLDSDVTYFAPCPQVNILACSIIHNTTLTSTGFLRSIKKCSALCIINLMNFLHKIFSISSACYTKILLWNKFMIKTSNQAKHFNPFTVITTADHSNKTLAKFNFNMVLYIC